jgi:short-subunit dehydrogenase
MGFAQALRDELRGQPLSVRVVCPPAVATPMLMNLPALPPVYRLSPPQPVEQVARAILRGLATRHWLVLLDSRSKLLSWAQRSAPWALDVLLSRFAG